MISADEDDGIPEGYIRLMEAAFDPKRKTAEQVKKDSDRREYYRQYYFRVTKKRRRAMARRRRVAREYLAGKQSRKG